MNTGRSYDLTANWMMFLAIFSIGVDGLAFLIYLRDRPAALFSVSLLLAWQVVFIVYFFRYVLPVYRRLPERGDHRATFLFLFRLAALAPAVWALAVWTTISSLPSIHH